MTTPDGMKKDWRLTYTVTADFRPYRRWTVRADGEAEARWLVSQETGISVDLLDAKPEGCA